MHDDARIPKYLGEANACLAAFDARGALKAAINALHLAREVRDQASIADALSIATRAHYQRGDYVAAVASGMDACAAAEGAHHLALTRSLTAMALSFIAVGDNVRANSAGQRALHCAQLAGDRSQEGIAFSVIGMVRKGLGDIPASLRASRRAIALFAKDGEPQRVKREMCNMGFRTLTLGRDFANQGNAKSARACWNRTIKMATQALALGPVRMVDIHLQVLAGEGLTYLSRTHEARKYLDTAAALCRAEAPGVVAGDLAYAQGELAYSVEDWGSAEAHWKDAFAQLADISNDDTPERCLDALGRLYRARGHSGDSEKWLATARQVREGHRESRRLFLKQMAPVWDRYMKSGSAQH